MYKEIFASLAKDSNLYYKIKSKEEAELFSDILYSNNRLLVRRYFMDSFESGKDCLILFMHKGFKDYSLVTEDEALSLDAVNYELTKKIVNPTYDDLLPLFNDTVLKEISEVYLDKVDSDTVKDYDTVEKPKHYNVFEKEVIYTIKDLLDNNENYTRFESYCIGNSLKYIFRAGLKGSYCEDLEKAKYYINKILEGRKWKKI